MDTQGSIPSTGDVLMLSQVAWQLARAFRPRNIDVPMEFKYVHVELHGLAKALKLLAEDLFLEDVEALLAAAEPQLASSIRSVLVVCKRLLDDLESLMDECQAVCKSPTLGGYSIQKSWNETAVVNYETMSWTVGGGTISDLKDVLRLATSSVSLLRQSLESHSLAQVEQVVRPLARRLEDIYSLRDTSVEYLIDELRAAVEDVVKQSPLLDPELDRSFSVGSDLSRLSIAGSSPGSARRASSILSVSTTPELNGREFRSLTDHVARTYRPLPAHAATTVVTSSAELNRLQAIKTDVRSASTADLNDLLPTDDMNPNTSRRSSDRADSLSRSETAPAFTHLPPSALEDDTIQESSSLFAQSKATLVDQTRLTTILPSKTTASQQEMFERLVFRNSAILCDLPVLRVEFTRPDTKPPFDTIIERVMDAGRICIVRRWQLLSNGESHFANSIWVFDQKLNVRMQQEIPDTPIVPYASFFETLKFSIPIARSTLKFFSVDSHLKATRTVVTDWSNYYFANGPAAAEFQNILYGRRLLGAFKTCKTHRVQDGISKGFPIGLRGEEMMCGLELLRIWEDEGSGGIFGMLHFSAMFSPGYLLFFLNSKENPLVVKDEGGKVAKIRGLRIIVLNPGRSKSSDKGGDGRRIITGAKIEFEAEADKNKFLTLVSQLQENLIEELPALY